MAPATLSIVDKEFLTICLVGGIYGKNDAYRSKVRLTPETLLESGLRARGHRVLTADHDGPLDLRGLDIVHVHHLGPACLRIASHNSNAAFVYTSHDGPAMAGLAGSLLRRMAARFVISRADAVVALSDDEAVFQKATYALGGAQHIVIPNGIDARVFSYARKNRAGQGCPWKLLYVGQLIEEKQVDVLLRAVAELFSDFVLDLVFHTDKLQHELQILASDLGVADRVRFLGAKMPEELKELYQSSDLVVLPSAAESLPSVISEAMLCGTPVVATDVGGIRNQLAGQGQLVPPKQVDALAHAIRSVIENYASFAARSEAVSRYARERFAIDNMVVRHLELYRLLGEDDGPRRRHRPLRRPLNVAVRLALNLLCKMS